MWKFKAEDVPSDPTPGPDALGGDTLLHAILERTGEVAYRYRLWPTLGYEYMTESVVDLLGYTADEIYANPQIAARLIHPDDAERMRAILDTPDGQEVEALLRWVHRDGRIIATELRCVVTRDKDGRPLWLDGVVRDVTLRSSQRRPLQVMRHRGGQGDSGNMPRPAQVLIAGDQELTRAGLRLLIAQDAGLDLVGEAEDGRELVRLAQAFEPDLALVDSELHDLNGLEATRQLKAVSPLTSVLLLSTSPDARVLLEAVRAGAAGYVLKNADEGTLRSAIWDVLAGDLAVDQELARGVLRQLASPDAAAPPAPSGDHLLSTREREVVTLLARGHTNREIADRLMVMPSTVKIHVEHILTKLGASDRTQAAVRAIELGVVANDRVS